MKKEILKTDGSNDEYFLKIYSSLNQEKQKRLETLYALLFIYNDMERTRPDDGELRIYFNDPINSGSYIYFYDEDVYDSVKKYAEEKEEGIEYFTISNTVNRMLLERDIEPLFFLRINLTYEDINRYIEEGRIQVPWRQVDTKVPKGKG